VKYVARMSFTDPSDGGQIVAGKTYVSREADVFRRFPERFAIARNSSLGRGNIIRIGPTVELRRPVARAASTRPPRPTWMLDEPEPESWRLR
jgi:hypothetical protein